MTAQTPDNPNRYNTMRAIGCNEFHYDNLIHKFFVTWCEAIALKFYHNDRDLIADERLYNYYQRQWQIFVEAKFIQDYAPYLAQNLKGATKTYYEIVADYALELEKYYPASLIRQPKPKTIKLKQYEFNLN